MRVTIPQARSAYTINATRVAGSNTEVITAPFARLVLNMPAKGETKIIDKL